VKQRARGIVLGIACFALGIAAQRAYDALRVLRPEVTKTVQLSTPPAAAPSRQKPKPVWTVAPVDRSKIDYSKQPLWAWGATEPPKPDERQAVQFAPGTGSGQNPNLTPEEQNRKRRLEDSQIELSLAEIRSAANGASGIVDWFPEDHPNPVPDIIKHGPVALGKDARACGSCHLADGSGRPENASPAGLPAEYIVRQLNDFKNDLRHSSDPRKANSNTMVMLAKAMTDEEVKQAAEYFSAVTWRPHVKVIETSLVPKTRIQGELFIPTEQERTEPIGERIIEVPTDVEASQTLRSSRGSWIAYVPVGSIKKGKELVTLGGMKIVNGQIEQGKTTACGACHGVDLIGVPPDVPPLVGRSPSYLAREIFDIQQGSRRGSNSNVQLMKMVVEKLRPDDIVNISAYLASRPIPEAPHDRFGARR
jgi:cytochrome c553